MRWATRSRTGASLNEALSNCSVHASALEFLGDDLPGFAVISLLFKHQPWARHTANTTMYMGEEAEEVEMLAVSYADHFLVKYSVVTVGPPLLNKAVPISVQSF